ncbi:hypothetical protein DL769_005902 [Monosporascus sp. CRB-8-3]|nr:hypothetical protein DL769_005902 [Monosporascus sp. CRB-8-3]
MSTPFPAPIDPEDPGRGPVVMGLNWSFTILAVVAVALRFYVRKKMPGYWTWDDWLMFVAVVCQVVGECLFTVSYHHGFGKHDYSLQRPDQYVEVMKWAWIAMGPGQLTSILARISITISLIGLFGVHRWLKFYLIVLTSIQSVLGVLMIFLSYTQARPIEGLWNVFLPGVWRLNPQVFINVGYLTQSIYTFADVSYVLLPVLIIWRLKMALHRRLGLIVLMAMSLFTATMSILKTYTIHWQGNPAVTDPLYRNSLQVLWANMEQTCVIIMGCVPTLRAIVKIELPLGLSRFGKSLASLIGRTTDASKASSAAMGKPSSSISGQSSYYRTSRSGGYHDLEMNTYKLGHHAMLEVSVSTRTPLPNTTGGSSESLVDANHVRRTDQFIVSYNDHGLPQ